jgi:shikimate dehydrogenase
MSRPYAEVIGDPIAHSRSPLIHNFWLDRLGIDAEYRACHVRPGELEAYFAQRRGDANWRGCNVTIPHKVAALGLMEDVDEAARSTGAANTIYRAGDGLAATNTDIDGILAVLTEELMRPGAKVCILGTGGAARAALAACKHRSAALVLGLARNQEAGRALLAEFRLEGCYKSLDDDHNIQTADVIINATSLGMSGKERMPQAVLDHLRDAKEEAVVFDMVYSPLASDLLKAARARGLRTVDGLAMLVGQAAVAFEKFFGQPAPRGHDAELRRILAS